MNRDQIEGNWKQVVGHIKAQWGRMTDDHLMEVGGSKDRLIGKVQELYGTSREEAEQQVRTWQQRLSQNPLYGAPGFAEHAGSGSADPSHRQTSDSTSDTRPEFGDSANQWWDDTRRAVDRGAHALSTAVQERPLVAVGCALGIGLILGLALRRR